MSKKIKFLEYVGRASSTASLRGRRLGNDVSVAAYTDESDSIVLKLESGGRVVRGASFITMSEDEYSDFKCSDDSDITPTFARAIHLFGATTLWS